MTKRDTLRKTAVTKAEEALDAIQALQAHLEAHPAQDDDTQVHYEHAVNHARDRIDRGLRGLKDDFEPPE